MKKIVCFLLIAVLLMTSCAFKSYEDGSHIIDDVDADYSVGETITLTVKDKKGNTIPNTDVLWSSSDFDVASVTGEGIVRVNGEGLCQIIARDKDNMEYYSCVEIFSPYSTVDAVSESISEADKETTDEALSSFVETLAERYGRLAVEKIALGTLNVVSLLISVGLDFLTQDQYWYSSSEAINKINDGVLYTVTDWTNASCSFSKSDLTPEKIFFQMNRFYEDGTIIGDSYNDFVDELQYQLSHVMPNNEVYYLDKMDSKYEYRIVIRGDVTTAYVYDYYSNGALDVLGEALGEIETWTLEELSDFAYTITKGELISWDNLRICIEMREKK